MSRIQRRSILFEVAVECPQLAAHYGLGLAVPVIEWNQFVDQALAMDPT
jgi:hypothetical protein